MDFPLDSGVYFTTKDAVGSAHDAKSVRRWLFIILFSAVFLQRFGIPLGPDGTPFNLMVTLGAIGALFLTGRVDVEPIRCALVLLFAAYSLVGTMFNGDHASWLSAGFVLATYIPFAFVLRDSDAYFTDCLRAYQSMMVVCAACGIAQFFLQYVISSHLLYTFHGFLPPAMLIDGFANLLPISYGSPLNRSNGFFMVEPSTFSQFVAISIIIELVFFQVKWRLILFGASLLFAYSGTGLVALVLVPVILLHRRSFGTIAVLLLFAGLAAMTSQLWHMDVIGKRATEFNSNESSAHARYFAPADLLAEYLLPFPQRLLFGAGPGSLRTYILLMPFETHDPAWAKLLFEYGIFGSILFWTLYILAVFVRSPSMWMSVALTIGYLSFGGELLDPRLGALLVVFCTLPKRRANVPATEPGLLRMAPHAV